MSSSAAANQASPVKGKSIGQFDAILGQSLKASGLSDARALAAPAQIDRVAISGSLGAIKALSADLYRARKVQ